MASSIWTEESYVEPRPDKAHDALSPDDISSEQRWQQRHEELLAARRLRDNWDGDGAEAPKPEVADTAIRLLRLLRNEDHMPPPTRISVSSNGTILLVWDAGECYMEAEVDRPDVAEWMEDQPGQPTRQWVERLVTREGDCTPASRMSEGFTEVALLS